jgi:predicted N-formylglutamate amidohydrolase
MQGDRRRPYLLIRPRSLSPVVLTCEHACRALPRTFRPVPPEPEVLRSHWGFDLGGWGLTRVVASRLRATAIGGRWSRLLIDLNRRVDDPTLIREGVDGTPLSWNRALDAGEVERRMLAYHVPYHAELDRLLLRRVVRGVRPLVVALHTFTPVLGRQRRGFDIGVLYDRHAGIAFRVGRRLAGNGFAVRYNEPYSGKAGMMYAAERHGAHYGLEFFELEVNQARLSRRGIATIGEALAAAIDSLVSPRGGADGASGRSRRG